ARGRRLPGQASHLPDAVDVRRPVRARHRARLRRHGAAPQVLRPRDRQAHDAEVPQGRLAVTRAATPAAPGAPGQGRFVGVAMFAPAVLYIVLLVAVPFGLAVLYAFSDARIGSPGFHLVGLENFRSILQSPSFRKALRNSIVFTLCAQAIVIVCSNILS